MKKAPPDASGGATPRPRPSGTNRLLDEDEGRGEHVGERGERKLDCHAPDEPDDERDDDVLGGDQITTPTNPATAHAALPTRASQRTQNTAKGMSTVMPMVTHITASTNDLMRSGHGETYPETSTRRWGLRRSLTTPRSTSAGHRARRRCAARCQHRCRCPTGGRRRGRCRRSGSARPASTPCTWRSRPWMA